MIAFPKSEGEGLSFPRDHFAHDIRGVEWFYVWGRLPEGDFFHFATFYLRIAGFRSSATHWSLHNHDSKYFEVLCNDFDELRYSVNYVPKKNWFTLNCKQFCLKMLPTKPVIHEATESRNYYSIPSMRGEGTFLPSGDEFKAEVWMDHEFTFYKKFSDWDWLGIRLDCGVNIMIHDSETDRRCSVHFNDKVIKSDFALEKNSLVIPKLGMSFILEPLVQEKIFDPRFGIPYSEQPGVIVCGSDRIGTYMRERTYRNKEKGDELG